MPVLVGDTSGLVSLGIASGESPDPLALCLGSYDVLVPDVVVAELRDVAAHDDAHGQAAGSVLDRLDGLDTRSAPLAGEFPLDDGENAAVTLANDIEAAVLFCDEFNRLGIIHASLADTRLVTTPTLLAVFVRREQLAPDEAVKLLDTIGEARSWGGNSYVERARAQLLD